VFGAIVTRFIQRAYGQMIARDERQHNGHWGVMGNPRHTNVSGVLLLPRPHLWNLRDERWQPLVVRNPWATHPLPDGFFPLPNFNITGEGVITVSDGQKLADILGLPAEWPPEDD
jgi:hypothetical protein